MIKQNLSFIIFLTLAVSIVSAQKPKNQFNENGERHGYWSKNYKTTKHKRYEGNFKNGVEDGLFKFYKLHQGKSVLSATKLFQPNSDLVEVKFYTSNGKVLSQGSMKGKVYIGKWLYYHKNSEVIMTVEHYDENGKLNGQKVTYYKNGKVAETIPYLQGIREGNSKIYSEDDVLLKEVNYTNDVLNGLARYYNGSGQITSEGTYKNNRKHGVWKFYKNGKLSKEIDVSKIKAPSTAKEKQ